MPKGPGNIRKRRYKVALLMEMSNEYSRGVIRGIYGYLKEHDHWDVYLGEYGRGEPSPEWLLSWHGDGIIARIENRNMADLVISCNLPTIDTSSANLVAGIPWVETDDHKIAELAFNHLRGCGLQHFGFIGSQYNWSKWRAEHFREMLVANGFEPHMYGSEIDLKENLAEAQKHIAAWLSTLPRPVGIFAAYDQLGRLLIDCCHREGLMVPEEVAVIGVDNDPFICELCSPPLTSIIPDTYATGHRVAALLEALLAGNPAQPLTNRIPPLGVQKRRSTDTLAIEDPYISKALHYIHEHAPAGPFEIGEILSFVPMTRRVFENKFRKMVGRSPYREHQRIKVGRIRALLHETDLGLQEISEKTGFEHASYMSYLCKRETGMTPMAFRNAK